jgi:hypothetical protein
MVKIYHRTGSYEARSIIKVRKIMANDREPLSSINAGPLFFLDGIPECEEPINPRASEVNLLFECHLQTINVLRDADYNAKLLRGDVADLMGHLILEFHPYVSEQFMQAKIIATQKDALRLVDYECQSGLSLFDKWRFNTAARNRLAISINSSRRALAVS